MAQEKTTGETAKKSSRSSTPRATAAKKAAARMSTLAAAGAPQETAAPVKPAEPPKKPTEKQTVNKPAQERTGALGMLETRGLVAALEASDAMVKAAKVTLIGSEKIGSGLVSVMVTGEVSAVRAAVEAGGAAAAELGEIYALHVIPNLHPSVDDILPTIKG